MGTKADFKYSPLFPSPQAAKVGRPLLVNGNDAVDLPGGGEIRRPDCGVVLPDRTVEPIDDVVSAGRNLCVEKGDVLLFHDAPHRLAILQIERGRLILLLHDLAVVVTVDEGRGHGADREQFAVEPILDPIVDMLVREHSLHRSDRRHGGEDRGR